MGAWPRMLLSSSESGMSHKLGYKQRCSVECNSGNTMKTQLCLQRVSNVCCQMPDSVASVVSDLSTTLRVQTSEHIMVRPEALGVSAMLAHVAAGLHRTSRSGHSGMGVSTSRLKSSCVLIFAAHFASTVSHILMLSSAGSALSARPIAPSVMCTAHSLQYHWSVSL